MCSSDLESANAAKGFQENFLSPVGGVGTVSKHAKNEVVNGTMIVRDQPVESRFRTGLQLDDEFGFIVAPRQGASPIGHGRPFRFALALRPTDVALR